MLRVRSSLVLGGVAIVGAVSAALVLGGPISVPREPDSVSATWTNDVRLTELETEAQGKPRASTARGPALLAGAWTTNAVVAFNFWTSSVLPHVSLDLYLEDLSSIDWLRAKPHVARQKRQVVPLREWILIKE